MKILAIHLKGFTDYALLKGISSTALLKKLNRTAFDFENPKAKFSEKEFYRVVELISTLLNDPLLGLRVGQQLNLNTLGVVYKITLKTKTLSEALHYCHSYLQKTFPAIQIKRNVVKNTTSFSLTIDADQNDIARIILETVLSVMTREIRSMAGEKTSITCFSPYRNNDYPEGWKKSDSFQISFRAQTEVVKNIDTWGLGILIPEYLSLIEEMQTDKSFSSYVKISALKMAMPKLPDLDTIAYNFNMKTRTLQRRLMDEGSSYRKISEELKKKISDLLLRHNRFSISDISAILGYAEPASFIHSFVKWHGKSPTQLRERLS